MLHFFVFGFSPTFKNISSMKIIKLEETECSSPLFNTNQISYHMLKNE